MKQIFVYMKVYTVSEILLFTFSECKNTIATVDCEGNSKIKSQCGDASDIHTRRKIIKGRPHSCAIVTRVRPALPP